MDDIDIILRKKALELARDRKKEEPVKRLTDEEAIAVVRQIVKGKKAAEIVENALALFKPYVLPLFRKIAELHREGVIKELEDHELYQMLLRMGIKVPISTELKIVRHGREYRIGES